MNDNLRGRFAADIAFPSFEFNAVLVASMQLDFNPVFPNERIL